MIRQYNEKDITPCAQIFSKAFSMETWGVSWSQERAESYLRSLSIEKKFIGYVCEIDGKIAGVIFGSIHIAFNADELHIDELFVDPKYQHQGIGQALLDEMKRYSIEHHLAGIVLYTNSAAPASHLYEKNGFKISDGTICMYWVK